MKSLERRFRNLVRSKIGWSLYGCFFEAVRGQKFSERAIRHWFPRLVDKGEYETRDRKALLFQLAQATNRRDDCTKSTRIAPPPSETSC